MIRFWWLKSIGGPGSLGFFLLVAAIGLILAAVSRRTRRIGYRLLLVLGASYFFLSLPIVGSVIADASEPFDVTKVSELGPINDIFVFDGDSYESRAVLTASLDRSLKFGTVWILGFEELRDALLTAGVRDAGLRWAHPNERTTYGQVVRMHDIMRHNKITRAVAVGSRVQADRIRGLTRQSGLNVVVVASPMNREPVTTGVRKFVPSLSGLALSRDGLYERAARLYYRWKGWM